MTDFVSFDKIPRYSRDIIITEKIDGTNAQIFIDWTNPDKASPGHILRSVGYQDWSVSVSAGSRNRFVTLEDDNYGWARWVADHAEELVKGLGPGRHFGEWWGQKIARGYGLEERRFSLFNSHRWTEENKPDCCHVVPTLWYGPHTTEAVEDVLGKLRADGSFAAPGFMNPEGVIIYHSAAKQYFKKTLEKDEKHKGEL